MLLQRAPRSVGRVNHPTRCSTHPVDLLRGGCLTRAAGSTATPALIASQPWRSRGYRLSIHAAIEGVSPDGKGRFADVPRFCSAFYRFTRPHTMLGTTVSIISVSLLALQGATLSQNALIALAQALSSALLMNISIVGLNQLADIEIDKVNKPYLPLASGEFSTSTGTAIVVASTVISLLLGIQSDSKPLLLTLVISWILGIVYSTELPFLRWKRYPVLAACCILAVRAVIVQLGFFRHMQQAIGIQSLQLTPELVFTVGFMLFFSIVIALFKDIPDVKGDVKAGVRTFSVRLGVDRVFWVCIALLLLAYGGATAFCLTLPWGPNKLVAVCGHLTLAALLWQRAQHTNLTLKQELVDFYMFVWKLFYAEYLLIPFLA